MMKIVRVKTTNKYKVYHYNKDKDYLYEEADVGTEFFAVDLGSTDPYFNLLMYLADNAMTFSSVSKTEVEVLYVASDKPIIKEIEIFKEVPVEVKVKEVVSLREVLGQEIKHIEF